jgi:hypothetical protein
MAFSRTAFKMRHIKRGEQGLTVYDLIVNLCLKYELIARGNVYLRAIICTQASARLIEAGIGEVGSGLPRYARKDGEGIALLQSKEGGCNNRPIWVVWSTIQ